MKNTGKNTLNKTKRKSSTQKIKINKTAVKKQGFFVKDKNEEEKSTIIDNAGILSRIKKNIIHFGYWGNGILLALLILLIYKGIILYTLGLVDGVEFLGSLHWYVAWLGNELLYIFLVRLFVLLGMRIQNKWIKSFFIFVALLLLLFFLADIFALKNFYSRFLVSVFGFFTWENALPYFREGIKALLGFFVFLIVCVYTSSWILSTKWLSQRSLVQAIRLLVLFFGLLIGVSFFLGKTSSYQQNVIQIQYKDSRWTLRGNDKPYEDYFTLFSGKNQKPNIIVVFAESFSSIDSLVMGGDRGLLSGFDIIAKDGTVYTNFVANGCTSDSAHIALLQGVEPWETNQLDQNYLRYKSYTLGLPAFMHQNGYNSIFLSTASLGFLDQRDFLISLQFDRIIGNEAFRNRKKYAFSAAPDEALYKKTEEIIQQNLKLHQPQFVVLQTISSHKPYNSPGGNTEEKAFAYSDGQLLQFYRDLQKINYFENGILVIVGDHRKMQSMSYEEIQKRGNSAYGRAVFTVVGKGIKKGETIRTPVQHLDIFSSLKRLVASGNINLHEYYNDIFGGYVGRDNAIRYCQYVDKQYIGTRADGSTWTILPSQKSIEASYIRSYYAFEGDRALGNYADIQNTEKTTSSFSENLSGLGIQSGSVQTGWVQKRAIVQELFPGIIRIAHQGYHKTAPGDSLAAFMAARNEGSEAVEMDITFTKDGYPIVAHGPDIGRIKCIGSSSVGKKNISDFTLQEMQDNCKLYNDQPILTLQEVLAKTKDMFTRYFVDVKIYNDNEIEYVSEMLDSVKKLGLGKKVIFSSVEKGVNEQLIQTADILAGWEVVDEKYLSEILKTEQKYILLPYDIVTQDIVRKIKKADKILVVYTLQDGETMKKLYDWGVRYFMSDDVQELVK